MEGGRRREREKKRASERARVKDWEGEIGRDREGGREEGWREVEAGEESQFTRRDSDWAS